MADRLPLARAVILLRLLRCKACRKNTRKREKSLFGDLLWVLERVFRTYINESSFHIGNALEAFHK